MTDLQTLVDPLKRELAVPGVFDDVFPDTSDANLADSLKDGFSEAQLMGYFTTLTLSGYETSEDISAAGGALVVLFTGMRIIRAQLRQILTSERYKAGSTEYEIQRSANLLRDELAFMKSRIELLVSDARKAGGRTVYVRDAYYERSVANSAYGAFYGYELGAAGV